MTIQGVGLASNQNFERTGNRGIAFGRSKPVAAKTPIDQVICVLPERALEHPHPWQYTFPVHLLFPPDLGQTKPPKPPPLSASKKKELADKLAYISSPAYQKELTAVYESAKQHIQRQVKRKGKGFVMLDIDETVLNNAHYYTDPHGQFFRRGYKFCPDSWSKWLKQKSAKAFKPARDFIHWMNTQGIDYAFVTGRTKNHSNDTFKNLLTEGLLGKQCLGLFCKPDDWKKSAKQFKVETRQELCRLFKVPVLASIGDQHGDMTDDPKANFKLPNPLYEIKD